MKKRNLLLIVPTLQLGGQERVAVNTAEIMGNKYNVTMIIFDGRDRAYTPHCNVIDLKIPAKEGIFNKILNVFKRAYRIRTLKKKMQADFSLSFGTSANLVNVLSGKRGKCIISIRGFDATTEDIISKFIYRNCDNIISVSKAINGKKIGRAHV